MKKIFTSLRDRFVAGLIFLLPLLILFVLLTKVFQIVTGLSTKIASLFGLKSIVGISGSTIVTSIGIVLVCIICGYLVKISTFSFMNRWLDKKLENRIPGYKTYRDMALGKIENKDEVLPYLNAAWVRINDMEQPAFVMEYLADGNFIVFVPIAGNSKQGNVYLIPQQKIRIVADANLKAFLKSIDARGLGITAQNIPSS